MNAKTLWVLGLLSLSGSASTQNCPAGTLQGPGCLPPNHPSSPYSDNYPRTAQPTAPRMIWADRWGAIAIDETNSGVGVATNMPSKRKAEKAAMAQCREKKGGGCRIKIAYGNQCGVIVWGDTYAAAVNSATLAEASELATKNCSQHTSNCRVYYSDCSMPERIQ